MKGKEGNKYWECSPLVSCRKLARFAPSKLPNMRLILSPELHASYVQKPPYLCTLERDHEH
ncbi:hypothetical protein Hanom_Chr16g01459231 [Helianthus anomalus]